LNTQKKAAWRTHNIKKHTTHEKEKRETFPQKKAPTQNTKSLSLSLSISFLLLSWCVSLFIQKFGREWTRGSQKTKNFAPPFLTVLSPLLRAPIQRELLPALTLARKNTFSS
jgi:hypothetical protein